MTCRPNTHIMLVSDQAAASLLPALDPLMKPDSAVLLVSRKMSAKAEALAVVLRETGIKTIRVNLPDEHDPVAIEDMMLKTASELDSDSIAINLTGGTKLMALTAQSIAQAAGWRMFYVDIDTDQVIWIDKSAPSQGLTQQLRLRHYLRGYGFHLHEGLVRPEPNAAWQRLVTDIIQNIGSLEEAIGQLNYLSQEAQRSLSYVLTPRQTANHNLDALLRKFEEARVLSRRNDQVIFPSEAARRFANGGWIEYHVYQAVCQVTGLIGIRDKASNLQVTNADGQPNEIDVAFMAKNRLFMIECKTARMDNPDDTKANDTLYKLAENCSRIGGLGTRGMLASYRALRSSELRLAKALRIEVVAGRDLARLDERLRNWASPHDHH
jgi:hypothetical protein